MRIWLSLLIGFMVGGSVSQAVNALPVPCITPANGVSSEEPTDRDRQAALAKVMNIILEVLQGQNTLLEEHEARLQNLENKQ